MNSTLPSALVHRPPKVITPTSRYAPRDDWCFAASKNVGADSISARARLRQDKPPRAHIECAPTDLAFNKGRQLHAGHRLCEGTPPATKNVGADSISARARLRQDKPPRAHIECAPTDFVFNKGRQLHAGHRLCEGNAPLRISFSTSALPVLGDTTKKESVTSKMSQTLGARYRTRTCDLLHVKQMLYQLS